MILLSKLGITCLFQELFQDPDLLALGRSLGYVQRPGNGWRQVELYERHLLQDRVFNRCLVAIYHEPSHL